WITSGAERPAVSVPERRITRRLTVKLRGRPEAHIPPRAHTVFQRPRRRTTHRSRTPPMLLDVAGCRGNSATVPLARNWWPRRSARSAPRAHNLLRRPRRQTAHASRPPPIVRPHGALGRVSRLPRCK